MSERRVLICEDDEGIIDVAQIVLEAKGYTVIAQTNSSGIYAQIAESTPDLILLDLWMPGLSGEDIVRHLKADEHTRRIPIIIMSASKDTAVIARNLGADAFLAKPFDIGDLENLVDEYIPHETMRTDT